MTNFKKSLASMAVLDSLSWTQTILCCSVDSDEEILALIFIKHLWQVLDVDMYVSDGIVLERPPTAHLHGDRDGSRSQALIPAKLV